MNRCNQHYLKSFTKHDEALLKTMVGMIETHPQANITMASYNMINVEGNGLKDFLQGLVNQVPVLDMKMYKVKQTNTKKRQGKHKVVETNKDIHSIYFTFYNLRI